MVYERTSLPAYFLSFHLVDINRIEPCHPTSRPPATHPATTPPPQMASLHDKYAEASAKAAFEEYKSAPNREDLVKMLAEAWKEHEPKMDASSRMGATDYTFEIQTEIDYTIKEIEQDMLPPEWAKFVSDGNTFNWKFDLI